MRQNPHVRICGGPGSATTLVYPTASKRRAAKALFMTVWCPDSRSVESNCGIPRG